MNKRVFTWDEVHGLVGALAKRQMERLPQPGITTVYGIPRGGAVVAGLLRAMFPLAFAVAESPADASLIVDDLVESGRTRDHYAKVKPDAAFDSLIEKRPGDPWLVLPWEPSDPLKDNEDIVVRLLEVLGEDPSREGLRDTPKRVLKAFAEMTSGYHEDPAVLMGKVFHEKHDEMVVVRGIGFWSLCEHHMLPFHGTATVGYIPNGRIVGLSKVARLVQAFAKRLQVQERLTSQVAEAIETHLKPLGVGVVIEAEHLCMRARGIKSQGKMTTSDLRGLMRDDPRARAEFLDLR